MALTRESLSQQLIGQGYSQSAVDNYWKSVDSGTSTKDAINTLKSSLNTQTTPTNTSSSGTINQNKTSSSSGVGSYSTGSSNSSYNSASGTTTTTTTQPKTYTTSSGTEVSKSDMAKSVADTWNSKSYQEQQDLLKKNPQLQTYLQQNGLTLKRETEGANQYNVADRPEAIQPNKPEQGWDYQSNEEWRTQEVIQNLDWYKRNNPSLFSSWENYKAFFIDGKGRSPEQEQLVAQYYRDYQKYKPYDNMSGSDIGVGLANGTIPSDYLDYLKNNDPVKYGEALEAMKGEQTKINNQSSYESLLGQEGFDTGGIVPGASSKGGLKEYLERAGIFIDKNSNGVDDFLYINPNPEEKKAVNRSNEISARLEEIADIKRNGYNELVKQYPGASKNTLMAMAQDQYSYLDEEYNQLKYEQIQLQGNIKYMQDERYSQMDARKESIGVLQKDLGMYYDYSAQGISELAQNKYAATNVSFEQADNGTYTQKQMALESVLTPIYEQYGSIIQRPQAQVINDIINYAQEKGIGLEQAFNENFMDKLKAKEAYQNIQNQLASNEPKLQTLGYNSDGKAIMGYWDYQTGTFKEVNTGGSTTPLGESIGGTTGNVVSGQAGLNNYINSIQDKIESHGKIREGWCGEPVNDYLASIGDNTHYGNNKSDKLNSITQGAGPIEGAIAIWDKTGTEDGNKYGHVAIVKSVNNDGTITVLESNVGTGLQYKNYKQSNVTGYHIPSSMMGGTTGGYNEYDKLTFGMQIGNAVYGKNMSDAEGEKVEKAIELGASQGKSIEDITKDVAGYRISNNKEFGDSMYNQIVKTSSGEDGISGFDLVSISNAINRGDFDGAVSNYENTMMDRYKDIRTYDSLARAAYTQGNNAISQINKMISSLGPIQGNINKTLKQLNMLEGSAQFQSLESTMQGMVAEWKKEHMGSAVTENEEKSLNGLIPKVTDSPAALIEKIKKFQELQLGTLNSKRNAASMPSLGYDTLVGGRSGLYSNIGSNQISNNYVQQTQSLGAINIPTYATSGAGYTSMGGGIDYNKLWSGS